MDAKSKLDTELTWLGIGQNLRRIRLSRGLTLKEVEIDSKGKWKAVVIGSYERTNRALTIKKAIALADFYQVPLGHLLGTDTYTKNTDPNRIRLDLRRIEEAKNIPEIKLFTAWIAGSRQDWNGEILSIRGSDILPLAIALNIAENEVLSKLENLNLLYK
ncbi:MAG: hypothetical protein WCJ90_01910 [Actinomycetes bacterium]|jgi:transcriptional regulator with XRE-family HTH domain